MIDFSLPNETQMLVATVKRFVEKELNPLEDEIERTNAIDSGVADGLRRKAQELGLWAMHMPEEMGGGGLSTVEFCLVNEQIGHTKDVLARRAFGHVPSILVRCAGAQREKYLHAAMRGEIHVSVAMSEPEAGSDANGIRTTARRDGEGWILNGSKHFISDADVAGAYIVTAHCEEGISCFLVDRDTPGLELGRIQKMMGHRGTHHNGLFLINCRIGPEQLLGELGRGMSIVLGLINVARLAYVGARAVGMASKLLEMSIKFAQQRCQFGAPIGSFQMVQKMLADMQTEIYAAKVMVLNAAWEIDQGRDAREKVSMVKLFASEMLGRVADNAVQIFGGMGYCTELPIERYYRDARVFRLYDGTSEIHRIMIARSLLERGDVPL
ncbi:acyl-CoA dehydrogenase [Verminephrobacter aporrectodeae subsp. tuberculatae]|uniref:Acyl-CoA dehydrogenase n=1 Tax=Verminephrobacter aporrectodeae subsp. tuberculatae TaxID=1110392 RepID=A0ABT3KYS8_9BURK|nr:acyl-CoA dehydrogenase family protein [Verminephrobacter aporrectodeae]MCW5323059.1 acyl-CoA dehydrogenase [Verminephrobacter aporrectodeae subsp. tuberculatae]MCW8198198.1 acyl-CoA dehydrogenase [Verminephrobacter aporrectodeae subsp. tuberculatae]